MREGVKFDRGRKTCKRASSVVSMGETLTPSLLRGGHCARETEWRRGSACRDQCSGASWTRLITRLKALYTWRTSPGNALLMLILFEFADFPKTLNFLLGVKRRAEHLVKDADRPGSG